jgi:GxxExxY protein
MPVILPPDIRQVTKDEFSRIAYDTMQVIFLIHNRLGRFLSEEIYQRAIFEQLPNAKIEVPVRVSFEDFSHDYSLDLLVDGVAVFELKAVSSLTERHRAQLLNYLMLTGLAHGKLVNLRTDLVVHEFVNCAASHHKHLPQFRPIEPLLFEKKSDLPLGLLRRCVIGGRALTFYSTMRLVLISLGANCGS